jgi:hypothetical protein
MIRFLKIVVFLSVLAGGIPAGSLAAEGENERTAQFLLFDANYLLPLAAPSRLVYSFTQKTAEPERYGQGFDDEVAMRLAASGAGGGQKDVFVDMFTGDRQRVLGPLTQVSGNPIIMMFLERDVTQMNRHVGGQPVYFRNVIRLAFREKAKLEPSTFSWNGKDITGTKITIQPFQDDPNGARMAAFRSKTYEFIVSDAVPGGIYEMHATMRGDSPDAPATPVMDSKLTLKGLAHDQTQH